MRRFFAMILLASLMLGMITAEGGLAVKTEAKGLDLFSFLMKENQCGVQGRAGSLHRMRRHR